MAGRPRVAPFLHARERFSAEPRAEVAMIEHHPNKSKSNEKAGCHVSQVDKWETKEGDTHM